MKLAEFIYRNVCDFYKKKFTKSAREKIKLLRQKYIEMSLIPFKQCKHQITHTGASPNIETSPIVQQTKSFANVQGITHSTLCFAYRHTISTKSK